MTVEITTTPAFRAGKPEPLGLVVPSSAAGYSTADGRRFLVAMPKKSKPEPYTVVLNWQAGMRNGLLNALQIGTSSSPALFGGGTTFENYVPGQSCLAVNPNSHFDPTTTLALNPNAWVDVGPGQYGVSAPYYNNCRWQRQPAESLSVGRIFRIREKYQLQLRAEFQNVFNRVFFSAPSVVNSTTAASYTNPFPNGAPGALSGGFGFVNTLEGAGTTPRTGQLVARLTF